MLLEKYPVKINVDRLSYRFLSTGPKGIIKKRIVYQKFGNNIFNIAFGDWNESDQKLDDRIRSNNNDHIKILATVAFTVLDFLKSHPDAKIFVMGNTPSKTRLYQISINANLEEINKLFNISGFRNWKWEVFERGRNYDAFLLETR